MKLKITDQRDGRQIDCEHPLQILDVLSKAAKLLRISRPALIARLDAGEEVIATRFSYRWIE